MYRFYAEGRGDRWEAICLDLDVAVQGESFEEVYNSILDAVPAYIESLSDLPEADQARLLDRRSPLSLRFRFVWLAVLALFRSKNSNSLDGRHEFMMAYPA